MVNYAVVILVNPKTAWGEELLKSTVEVTDYISHMLAVSWLDVQHIQVTKTQIQAGDFNDGAIHSQDDVPA